MLRFLAQLHQHHVDGEDLTINTLGQAVDGEDSHHNVGKGGAEDRKEVAEL